MQAAARSGSSGSRASRSSASGRSAAPRSPIFDLPTAQQLFDKPGQLDEIRIQSKPGVASRELISEIQPLLPPTAVVRDTNAQVKEDKKDRRFISFLQYILLAFAGIALFVGAFVIANTLSITIAQRMREFATLRTLGASRRQVLWSVMRRGARDRRRSAR